MSRSNVAKAARSTRKAKPLPVAIPTTPTVPGTVEPDVETQKRMQEAAQYLKPRPQLEDIPGVLRMNPRTGEREKAPERPVGGLPISAPGKAVIKQLGPDRYLVRDLVSGQIEEYSPGTGMMNAPQALRPVPFLRASEANPAQRVNPGALIAGAIAPPTLGKDGAPTDAEIAQMANSPYVGEQVNAQAMLAAAATGGAIHLPLAASAQASAPQAPPVPRAVPAGERMVIPNAVSVISKYTFKCRIAGIDYTFIKGVPKTVPKSVAISLWQCDKIERPSFIATGG